MVLLFLNLLILPGQLTVFDSCQFWPRSSRWTLLVPLSIHVEILHRLKQSVSLSLPSQPSHSNLGENYTAFCFSLCWHYRCEPPYLACIKDVNCNHVELFNETELKKIQKNFHVWMYSVLTKPLTSNCLLLLLLSVVSASLAGSQQHKPLHSRVS